ncbi:hypothetical protein BK120_29010 [Paenibacillus sp. FSL A5-0031]|uniref:hypothetical protein n=1 Tax=Paenibacillus sp. FSL A5-0031 TaxID=1920420 RepID=UPI00096FEE12|nr:hypothetical protein [Paenibacillus sp. FSL A5-0031]OME76288.1 hypothetical protein BK120_29010 [Paenibacillus sp. FSL A5-0031]
MERIYPLHEEVVSRFCGYPVCVIMNDGMRHFGILSSCESGRLHLNAGSGETEAATANAKPQVSKNKKGGKGKKEMAHKSSSTQVQTQAYPYDPYYYGERPYYPWGEALALDLASIAFLFLLL